MSEMKLTGHYKGKVGQVILSSEGIKFENSNERIFWDEFSFHLKAKRNEIIAQNLTKKRQKIRLSKSPAIVDFIKASELSFSNSDLNTSAYSEYVRGGFYIVIFSVVSIGLLHGLRFYAGNYMELDPVEEEIAWSQDLYKSELKKKFLPKDDPKVIQLNLLSQRLLKYVDTGPYKININIQQSTVSNAYAYPGGIIVFTTALLEKAKTPEEILGILSHELAHVKLRHGYRRKMQQEVTGWVSWLLFSDSNLINFGDFLSEMTYSREAESEADQIGLRYLEQAQISAQGIRDFFERKKDSGLEWISSHPEGSNRVSMFKQQINQEANIEAVSFDLDTLR